MQRQHIPNLYLLSGEPNQGKTTLAKSLRSDLRTAWLQIDACYWTWARQQHPQMYAATSEDLPHTFSQMPIQLRELFFTHLVKHIGERLSRALPDFVVDGWLAGQLPAHTLRQLTGLATVMTLVVRNRVGHISRTGESVTAEDAAKRLPQLLRSAAMRVLFPKVPRQCFSRLSRDTLASTCQAAMALPEDLSGKVVLDLATDTGFYALELARRGAAVFAVDTDHNSVALASRLANAVYRRPDVRFYVGDWLTDDFQTQPLFDLVLAHLDTCERLPQLLARVAEMLSPGGTLVLDIETAWLDISATVIAENGFALVGEKKAPASKPGQRSLVLTLRLD